MPGTSSRKLAAILFADIAGYTALMQKDEATASSILHCFQKEMENKVSSHDGRIVNFYGDGALCIFQNPLEAVRCAMDLQINFKNEPAVPVRIGIHSGTVVFENEKVYGDSVNLASRIESMGVPGAVLLSNKIRDDIKNHPEFQLVSLGSFEFKNVDEPMEVFALANEGFPVPKRSEMEGKLKTATQASGWKKWAWAAGIALVALAAWLFLKDPSGRNAAADAKFEKSIAVLPFRNESADTLETQYFCNNVMVSILNHLSQIGELRVICRQSIERYRGSTEPAAKIAKQLGVAHLLEGSVQRASSKVKINAQLIHAATDRYLWTKEFVGEMDDIFALQSRIAQAVAEAMQATISPDLKSRIERVPTANMDAWQLYIQAEASFESIAYGFAENDPVYFQTLSLCDQALALDSTLAEAWTLKAQAWWQRNYWREVLNENFMDSVATFAHRALALDAQSALAYTMLGKYFNETGEQGLGLEYLQKAVELNPNQVESQLELGAAFLGKGNFKEAYFAYRRALHLAPNSVWTPTVYHYLAWFYLAAADLKNYEHYLLKAKPISITPGAKSQVISRLVWLKTIEGKFDESIELAEEFKGIDSTYWLQLVASRYGYIKDFPKSLDAFEKLNKIAPQRIRPVSRHRWAYALWNDGRKEEALNMFKEAEKSMLKTVSEGRSMENTFYDLTGIYSFLGQKEKAWTYLREYEKIGKWSSGLPYFIQVDPLFDNLRNGQEFKQMLERVFAEKAQLQEQIRRWEAEEKL